MFKANYGQNLALDELFVSVPGSRSSFRSRCLSLILCLVLWLLGMFSNIELYDTPESDFLLIFKDIKKFEIKDIL